MRLIPLKLMLVMTTSCLSQKECSAVRGHRDVRAPTFRPAFHQVLRGSLDSPRMTYRVAIPIQRAGSRLRASFESRGRFQLNGAAVRATPQSSPIALAFDGLPGFKTDAPRTVRSDPVAIAIEAGSEIVLSFDIEGSVAASSFDRFPEGSAEPGGHALDAAGSRALPFQRGIGLTTIEIEGEQSRVIVAIGDSITEGYISGHDDIRDSWPMVAQRMLGVPVIGAAVSGQGVADALASVDRDVLSMEGITDCVILLGTNDLGDHPDVYIVTQLEALAHRLASACQVWTGTILPKDWTLRGSYPLVAQRRKAVNDWLRKSRDHLIDFDAALRDPASPHRLKPGTSADGIHINANGHRLVALELVKAMGLPITAKPGAGSIGLSTGLNYE